MRPRILSSLLIFFLFLSACGKAAQTTPATSNPVFQNLPAPAVTATSTSAATASSTAAPLTYPIVDSGQGKCYDNNAEIACPLASGAFFGEDAQYSGLQPAFTKNSDGTVSDKNTGLIWQQTPDVDGNGSINAADKLTYSAAGERCKSLELAGQSDWRLPDIKTLYSLIDLRGTDPDGATGSVQLIPFLDSSFFGFAYGDTAAGEHSVDAQFASSTLNVDTGSAAGTQAFVVNFADGTLKAEALSGANGTQRKFFVLCVRDNTAYGANRFSDNGDETISDLTTGLVWQKADSAKGLNWQDALAYCEGLSLAGQEDWRLPDAKSLQSLVDYSRSPVTSNSAAIDALFGVSEIKNEAGQSDSPYYWTSSTHTDFSGKGVQAATLAFGRAMGHLSGAWLDVDGAGAQLNDLKSGNPANYPNGLGSKLEAVRILNYVRCVRGGNVTSTPAGNPGSTRPGLTVLVSPEIPDITPPAGGSPPSQAAIDACSAKKVGDACHYDTPIGNINGTCQDFTIPGFQVLACIPSGLPLP
jgi:hypothetical protein